MAPNPQARARMILELSRAYARAEARACNPDHAALIIERLLSEAGYRIYREGGKKKQKVVASVPSIHRQQERIA